MAARISHSSLLSEARNASAAPWKLICTLSGSASNGADHAELIVANDGGVVSVVDATTTGGWSRGQASAQLARAAHLATSDQVDAFSISVEAAQDSPSQELFDRVMQHLGGAITALQFQDMASQLIAHTNQRLRNCADRLARETMGDDEDGAAVVEDAPLRPNPVTQDEMDAGSVELF